jgi:peptidase S46-like protein
MKKLSLALCLFALPLAADEGMWMPQQIPQLSAELQKSGIKIDPSRLADLTGDPMGAVISLGGCTASFVSPSGLAVTNHHCAFNSIRFNSTPQRDLLKKGFVANELSDELPAAPGSRISVTTNIEDVTDRVIGTLPAKLDDRAREQEISRREKQLVADCEKPGGVRCRVAAFFEGSQYLRLTQMEIRDVRLVYAPAEGIGNFGGETDNWMWPRHTGDWSFYRAYVGKDGKPADFSKDNVPFKPAHWLKVATTHLAPGDFVMVAGYPGRTFRYRTESEVTNSRDFTLPITIRYATELSRILNEAGNGNREIQIKNASRLRGLDNTLKNNTGALETLTHGGIVAHRHQRETALGQFVASNAKYAGVMESMRKLDEEESAAQQRDAVLTWIYRSSPMLTQARQVYRSAIEREKKDIDRNTGFMERDQPALFQASQRAQSELDMASDRAGLRFFLAESQKLPANQRIAVIDDAIAKAGGVDQLLDALYANTKIGVADERKAMYAQTPKQLDARNDSMLNFAAKLIPLTLENEAREQRIAGAMSRVRPMYLAALRDMSGGRLYPDANGTLRITWGHVVGYSPKDAVEYDPQTTVEGVLQKNTGKAEFDSPPALLTAIRNKTFDGYANPRLHEVTVDFLSDVDTTGGNSGSPTLNANGELCGLLFDGTYESLGSDYLFEANTRSIHVDTTYMLWVMDAVDHAHSQLREMGIAPRF